MLKIRFQRRGKKGQPTFRAVVAESKTRRDGKFIEILGHYNPKYKSVHDDSLKDNFLHFNVSRCNYWLKIGAQPTEAFKKLFKRFQFHDRQ